MRSKRALRLVLGRLDICAILDDRLVSMRKSMSRSTACVQPHLFDLLQLNIWNRQDRISFDALFSVMNVVRAQYYERRWTQALRPLRSILRRVSLFQSYLSSFEMRFWWLKHESLSDDCDTRLQVYKMMDAEEEKMYGRCVQVVARHPPNRRSWKGTQSSSHTMPLTSRKWWFDIIYSLGKRNFEIMAVQSNLAPTKRG